MAWTRSRKKSSFQYLEPLWYSTDIISNEYINGANGQAISDSGSERTDYIEVTGGETITILYYSNWASANYTAYYDANKTYISGMGLTKNIWNVITVPDNAKYFRLSGAKDSLHGNSCLRSIGFPGNAIQ